MTGNYKHKPKSCGCAACRQPGNSRKQFTRRAENKAWRTATKAALRKGAEDVNPVLTGTYTD
jgi:hypothetical protein